MEILIDNEAYTTLLASIRFKYGYDFLEYAEPSVKRRISNFMYGRNIENLDVLEKTLLDDEVIFEQFVQGISVTVTEMFRDPLFYKSLRDLVVKRLATYPMVKLWIA